MNPKITENQKLVKSENEAEKSTNFQAGVNLFKCSVGIGVLALPYYYNAAGYLLSAFTMFIITLMTFYSTLKIIEVADLKGLKETNYKELYSDIIGENYFSIFQILMGASYFGVCASYVIFFMEYFQQIFGTTDMSYTLLYALFALCVILPMSLIRDFHLFVRYSFFASALIMIVLSCVSIYCFENLNIDNLSNLADFSELPGILGVFLFAFESPGQLLQIRNSMKNKKDFKNVFIIVNLFVLFIYISFSIFCCLGFSSTYLTQNILTGFGELNQYYEILVGLYAVALIISYPIQINPLVEVCENITKIKTFLRDNDGSFLKRNSIRLLLSLIIFPFGIFITNFGDFVSLIGTFSGLIVQFVVPLWAYNLYLGKKLNTTTRMLHYFIIIVSVIGTFFAFYSSLETLISDYE